MAIGFQKKKIKIIILVIGLNKWVIKLNRKAIKLYWFKKPYTLLNLWSTNIVFYQFRSLYGFLKIRKNLLFTGGSKVLINLIRSINFKTIKIYIQENI